MHELSSVRKGITCILYGLLMIVGGFLLVLLGAFIASSSPSAGRTVVLLAVVLLLGGTLLGLVGRIFCLWLPPEVQASKIIQVVVACEVVVLLATVAMRMITVPIAMVVVSNLMSLVAAGLFLIFLKGVGVFIRDDLSVKRAGRVLILGTAALIATVGGLFLRPLLLAAFFLFAFGAVTYLRLLLRLRTSLHAGTGMITATLKQEFANQGVTLVDNYRRRGIHAGFGRGAGISDDDLVALIPLDLHELYLSRTQLSDESLSHLAAMNRLNILDLSHTNVSRSGVDRLKLSLPQTTIIG